MELENEVSVIVSLRDITRFYELEKKDKFSSLKTIMLGAAAHEFRNPLSGIISMLGMIEHSGLDQKARGHLTIAKTSADLLLFLSNDMLDYA